MTTPADEAMKLSTRAALEAADAYWFEPEKARMKIAVEAVIRALDAAGWQLVPKVATEEMYSAAIMHSNPVVWWDNMLAAAPKLVEVKP